MEFGGIWRKLVIKQWNRSMAIKLPRKYFDRQSWSNYPKMSRNAKNEKFLNWFKFDLRIFSKLFKWMNNNGKSI